MDKNYKYIGSWSTNNHTTFNSSSYYGNNKQQLSKEIRDICKANTFSGNSGIWYVDEANSGETVLTGKVYNKI